MHELRLPDPQSEGTSMHEERTTLPEAATAPAPHLLALAAPPLLLAPGV